MRYTSRGLKRRRGTDKWDVTLILDLERNGDAFGSKITLKDFLDKFIDYKEGGLLVERSTSGHYRKQAEVIAGTRPQSRCRLHVRRTLLQRLPAQTSHRRGSRRSRSAMALPGRRREGMAHPNHGWADLGFTGMPWPSQ